jgi:probable 2-oxoglutarate dehydrogenase E1 component DHKTD1
MEPGTHFKPVIDDIAVAPQRVLFLSGKLYYELYAERQKLKLEEKVALIRVEELCPFPAGELNKLAEKYEQSSEFFWIQEEPQNQGAWTFIEPRFRQLLGSKVRSIHYTTQAKILGFKLHWSKALSCACSWGFGSP